MKVTMTSPTQIGASGWKAVLFRVKDALTTDHVGLVSAGVAFYGLLAIFPAIAAVMAIAGLVLAPADVAAQLDRIADMMPARAAQIITDQATSVAGSANGGLGLTALVGMGLALWSSSKGVATLIEGLNIVYKEPERRGFLKLKLTTLGLTLLLIVGLVAGLGAVLILPALLSILNLGDLELVIAALRWVLLFGMTVMGAAALYRFGPDRRAPLWSWTLPGALLASVLWVAGSVLFSFYAENFGSYQETFGSLAGVVILLFWLWISAYVILLGAEVNAELEVEIKEGTATDHPEPNALKPDAVKG
ncbi:YihY/virulence factor BrkB family protein [Primorskyibacter sp. 2E107]|uniref:YihY/virulence factor BrkB family protein n=1 Tax=Primorskyibacter sp. 2E107 TaxID=3403458 RepID=UPI003AF97D4B